MKNLFTFLMMALPGLWLTGCDSTTPMPTPSPTPPSLADLQFEDADIGERIRQFDTCIQEQITNTAWTEIPYQTIGNFYEAKWCQGTGARGDCQVTDEVLRGRDVHVITLATFTYPAQPHEAFGLSFRSTWLPPAEGWGVQVSFHESGRNIVSNGYEIHFYHYTSASGEATEQIHLGNIYDYQVYETGVAFIEPLPIQEGFAHYLSFAESLRNRGLASFGQLSDAFYARFNAHQFQTCTYNDNDQHDSIPPLCELRPLTPEEETTALKNAETYFAAQTRILNNHYQELYVALSKAFPFDSCWR